MRDRRPALRRVPRMCCSPRPRPSRSRPSPAPRAPAEPGLGASVDPFTRAGQPLRGNVVTFGDTHEQGEYEIEARDELLLIGSGRHHAPPFLFAGREGDVFQRTPAGVRGGRGPGSIDDAGVARGGHQEDSVERQSNRPKPADTPRTKPFCILSPHVHPFDPGNPTLRLTLRAHESLPILRLSTTEVSGEFERLSWDPIRVHRRLPEGRTGRGGDWIIGANPQVVKAVANLSSD